METLALEREKSGDISNNTEEAGIAYSKIYEIAAPTIRESKVFLFFKRCFDIAASLTACIIFLIPMVIIAVLIHADSSGPIVFKQERLGKKGKPFTIYKFRTMRVDAEAKGPQWAEKEDDRCTRVGAVLRKTHLDELPQFYNILSGDMSFVGPRPERACFYEQFETYIHGFHYRLSAKPGLTGLAQVNGGYDLLPEEKIVYDMEYIEKCSIRMDLYCVFKTISLVFTHEGAR